MEYIHTIMNLIFASHVDVVEFAGMVVESEAVLKLLMLRLLSVFLRVVTF